MRTSTLAGLVAAAFTLSACVGAGSLLDSGPNLPPENPTVETGTLAAPPEAPPAAEGPVRPATKSNVVAMEYSSNLKYADLAKRIDATFRNCWIGKNEEFAGYSYAGLTQDGVKYVIALTEDVNGAPLDLVKITIIPAAGQDGYAISLETRAEGSPGEKIIKEGIRHIAAGQKVCG